MSNRASKLQETIKLRKAKEELALYATLPGSIITSIGILSKSTTAEIKANFKNFKKKLRELTAKEATIEELVELAYKNYGKCDRELLANLILVTDIRNFYTPLVTIIKVDEILPLDPKGLAFGVIGMARDLEHQQFVELEYLFDDDGNPYKDETEELEKEMR